MTKKPLTKIIFVDDDPDLLTIAQYSLENIPNISVKYLSSGEAAIQEALQFKPDLILLDVMMPKMDGIATFNTMRLIPSIAHIPVVFITAKVQKEEITHYSMIGILDVIIKPFNPLTLQADILKIWDKFQEAKEG